MICHSRLLNKQTEGRLLQYHSLKTHALLAVWARHDILALVREIYSCIACNLDAHIISASYPLLNEARVDAIEWSFDALYKHANIPPWFFELLDTYANNGRLIGHGVFFSLFSGRWSENQQQWLQHLRQVSTQFRFDHITEHFGFMTGKDFHHGAPLNIPFNQTTLNIGRDRLARIYEACHCPVGLENLAFSYSADEVKRHGEFLEKLIEPINGFIILDLHNLYCQLHNFSLGFEEIINLYPLHRVREIHISGGSWENSTIDTGRKVRRDTHDDSVPEEVFALLHKTIPLCPALKFVVLEQVSPGLQSGERRQQFYDDFVNMQRIVKQHPSRHSEYSFLPIQLSIPSEVVQDEQLHSQQMELSDILETAPSYNDAKAMLQTSSLANTAWKIEEWAPYMLETAISIAQKWKKDRA